MTDDTESGTATAADSLADAALEIAAADGWRAVSVAAAAERAGLDRATARRVVRCKAGLLAAIADQVDRGMRAGLDTDATDPDIAVRDRLFEALMARMDVLGARRDGFVAILDGVPRDPPSALAALPSLGRSMARTLEAVGERTALPFGPLKVKGLALVWLATLRVWRRDDSPDMAASMKALDGYLARAEEAANSVLAGGCKVNAEVRGAAAAESL